MDGIVCPCLFFCIFSLLAPECVSMLLFMFSCGFVRWVDYYTLSVPWVPFSIVYIVLHCSWLSRGRERRVGKRGGARAGCHVISCASSSAAS
jgi:hypothetical protein